MILLSAIIALLISFYLLNEITDKFFVPSLDAISHKLKMSDDAAGATLMAAGSSAPELFISIIAVIYGGDNLDIGVGTIVGSALFNLLVIIGAVAFVRSSKVAWQPMFRDMLFYVLSIGALYWAFSSGVVTIWHVIGFISLYVVYVIAVLNWKRIFPYERVELEEDEDEEDPSWKKLMKPVDFLIDTVFGSKDRFIYNFLISVALIALLSWVLVESAVVVSDAMGIPKYIVALTILAFGTSVPDMMSSVIVAKQGRGGMAISNALGSNIFDILLGLGLPWLILIIGSGQAMEVSGSDITSHIFILLASVVGMFIVFLITRWRVNRFVGAIFLGSYLVYLVYVIMQAI
ncbi:MAG: calcium/sodium antiporter [Bacteroidales bacterium]|nr:calcium/sodium antiporter [Bacteroidales bacterium]